MKKEPEPMTDGEMIAYAKHEIEVHKAQIKMYQGVIQDIYDSNKIRRELPKPKEGT